MNTFIQKYDPNINGVLGGFDRLVTNNTFAANAKTGIGGLGGGGDTFNVAIGPTRSRRTTSFARRLRRRNEV